MYTYNTSERTVTLTYDEYIRLVKNDNADREANQCDLLALELMEKEDADDYTLSIAYMWLLAHCQITKFGAAQWHLDMNDLGAELRRVYDNVGK